MNYIDRFNFQIWRDSLTDTLRNLECSDLSGKKLWTFNGTENIILSGADIEIGDLPSIELPDGGYITLTELVALAKQNEADIADLEGRVSQNESDISQNQTLISQLDFRIGVLERWQQDHEEAVGNLLIAIGEISDTADEALALAESNKGEIDGIIAEIGLIEAGMQYGGNFDASTNLVTSVSALAAEKGVSAGQPLQNFVSLKGFYYIVTNEGTLQNVSSNVNGEFAYRGDWLISDGTQFLLANYQMETVSFADLAGKPTDNAEMASELALYLKKDGDVLEGGTYTPKVTYSQKMADAKK